MGDTMDITFRVKLRKRKVKNRTQYEITIPKKLVESTFLRDLVGKEIKIIIPSEQ